MLPHMSFNQGKGSRNHPLYQPRHRSLKSGSIQNRMGQLTHFIKNFLGDRGLGDNNYNKKSSGRGGTEEIYYHKHKV